MDGRSELPCPTFCPEEEGSARSWYGFLEDLLTLEAGGEPAVGSWEWVLLREAEEDEELVLEESLGTFLLLVTPPAEPDECLCEEESEAPPEEEWWWF